jgi:hypothetical protein
MDLLQVRRARRRGGTDSENPVKVGEKEVTTPAAPVHGQIHSLSTPHPFALQSYLSKANSACNSSSLRSMVPGQPAELG